MFFKIIAKGEISMSQQNSNNELITALKGLVGETGLDEESCVCDNTHDQHGTKCQYCYARKVLKQQLLQKILEKEQPQKVLEKHQPQKVIQTDKHSQACPTCGSAVNWLYCSNCGQKLSY